MGWQTDVEKRIKWLEERVDALESQEEKKEDVSKSKTAEPEPTWKELVSLYGIKGAKEYREGRKPVQEIKIDNSGTTAVNVPIQNVPIDTTIPEPVESKRLPGGTMVKDVRMVKKPTI